jgi:HAD superfamily hydrolase (TIGR01509 family)
MREARVIDAVAWDIDGTLIDSEPLHHRALLGASASFGVDLKDLPPLSFRGVHMDEVWLLLRDRLPAALERAVWIEAIEDRYVACVGLLQPIGGATATLARLHRADIAQICVSNSSRRVVDANLMALGAAPYLRFSISFDDVANGKPRPQPYATAAARLAFAPARLLAVEHSRSGLASAHAAGLRTAAIAGEAELEAGWQINSLTEVADIVLIGPSSTPGYLASKPASGNHARGRPWSTKSIP